MSLLILLMLMMSGGSEPLETLDETVYVHEWGVVQIDEAIPMAQGAQRGYLDENGTFQPYSSLLVDAPVIWFHGPSFTGTLIVEVQNGYFTLLIPNPAMTSACDESIPVFRDDNNYVAIWEDLEFFAEDILPEDRRNAIDDSTEDGFQWAMPFWRNVPALTVEYESASYSDRFIYYECSASNLFEEHDSFRSNVSDVIVFYIDDGELAADLITGPGNGDAVESYLSPDRILDILAEWGGGEFLDEEIEALMQTWEPVLQTRCAGNGQRVVLFPLNDEQVESISTIDLHTDQDYHVEYSRLFLAMGSI